MTGKNLLQQEQILTCKSRPVLEGLHFLTYETEFVLFLAVLESSVLPMG